MNKLLLDTDIGSDIDDAVCLAYLLAHRENAIWLGLLLLPVKQQRRASLADVLCRGGGSENSDLSGN